MNQTSLVTASLITENGWRYHTITISMTSLENYNNLFQSPLKSMNSNFTRVPQIIFHLF